MTNFNDTLETMNELGNKGYDNLRKLGEIQLDTFNKLFEKQAEVFSMMMSSATAQLEAVSESKDYQDAVRSQIDFGQKLAANLVEKTRETVEIAQQSGDAYRTWAEGVAKETAEQVNEAAKQAA